MSTKKYEELEQLYENLKRENENLTKQLNMNEDLNDKLAKMMDENSKLKLEVYILKLWDFNHYIIFMCSFWFYNDKFETQIKKIKEEHVKEIKIKDEKLELLKKQISNAFKDNSW